VFVTFEGIEGCGKSTQIARLARTLGELGQAVSLTREPGGCELGRTLRAILLSTETRDLSSRAELFLYLADRAQHVASVIRPALDAGAVVLCDRFADSTVAYQGYGRGLDVALLARLNAVAVAGTWPDCTILLDLDPETGLTRARARNAAQGATVDEGRFEAEALAFHARVRRGYRELAAAEPDRTVVIDAGRDIEAVARDVWETVRGKMQQGQA
jgi:dTMP kinase